MNTLIFQVVAMIFFLSIAYGQERQAYMKREKEDPYVTVYKKPGINWKYCQKNVAGECVDAMGWLDKDAKIWVTGPKLRVATPDPLTDEMVEEEYYPVKFSYERIVIDKTGKEVKVIHEKGPIGYIDAAYVDFVKREPLYSATKSPTTSNKICQFDQVSMRTKIEDLKCALVQKNIEEASQKLKEQVGFCADMKSDDNKKANLYDNIILKKLKEVSIPKVKGEDDQYMSQQQMIDIDSLARTLYGEMASCYKHGLHYPMAVARIALNRSEETKQHKTFIQGQHKGEKSNLSKVLTTPSQFSVWFRKVNGEKNPPLRMAMCPPRNSEQFLLNGKKPTPEELAIWNHTMKIATEAVLFPQSFKKRTESLNQRFFYTSGMGQFFNMKKDSIKIEGRNLDKSKCIEIWSHEKS